MGAARVQDGKGESICPPDAWAVVTSSGAIHLHPTRRGAPDEWAWVLAHCLLHLAFGHIDPGPASGRIDRPYNVAACLSVNRFLLALKVGRPPTELEPNPTLPAWVPPSHLTAGSEHLLAAELRSREIPTEFAAVGTATSGDLAAGGSRPGRGLDWDRRFADGLEAAVAAAIAVAGGELETLSSRTPRYTSWGAALRWFVSSFPLLGALASGLRLVEESDVCARMDIAVAAVSPVAGELYVNPTAHLTLDERRFVIGHELLHAGLRHDTR